MGATSVDVMAVEVKWMQLENMEGQINLNTQRVG